MIVRHTIQVSRCIDVWPTRPGLTYRWRCASSYLRSTNPAAGPGISIHVFPGNRGTRLRSVGFMNRMRIVTQAVPQGLVRSPLYPKVLSMSTWMV